MQAAGTSAAEGRATDAVRSEAEVLSELPTKFMKVARHSRASLFSLYWLTSLRRQKQPLPLDAATTRND